MRLRAALLAVASVCALGLALPGTASAAVGDFTYRYYDENEELQVGSLVDPPSGECIEIPEIADWDVDAFRPRNDTDSTAVVFTDDNCESDRYFSLRPFGGKGSDRLKLRSVTFS
ncbi:hypothetical protein [Crossiella sp. CA198]|uniref:hypothetical protein n=1 Tax=Crossiella sp. CA198 TaxID=3455607 RepID=UPI003F8CFA31